MSEDTTETTHESRDDGFFVNMEALHEHLFGLTCLPLHGARGNGQYAVIHVDDYPLVGSYRWFLGKNGYVRRNPSQRKGAQDRESLMHRMIMRATPDEEIDHWNRKRWDNRRTNLRRATRAQNNANHPAHRHNRTGIKGVRLTATGRFTARIRYQGTEQHLGNFDTIEAATEAYNIAARALYGAYARLNQTEEDTHV